MSGGRFNYENDYLCSGIFNIYCDYGEDGFKCSKEARKRNPLEDKMISELVFDVFCLLHSYDWYASGDTSEKTYQEDIKYFKDKWLKKPADKLIKDEIDKDIAELKEELYKTLGVFEVEE